MRPLALDDQALFVIRQRASLQRDERLALFGFHNPDVVRIYDHLIQVEGLVVWPARVPSEVEGLDGRYSSGSSA